MNTSILNACLYLFSCAALLAGYPTAVSPSKPNILLILSDDHSLPHVGAYGDPNCQQLNLTPNLDAFAAEGMRFTRAYTSAPQCAPSRTAIFAGRSPVGIATTRFSQPAQKSVPLFTDLLRDSGYWVGLDGRNHHLDGKNRELPHVDAALVAEGMRGAPFEARFDHHNGGNPTKGEKLKNVPAMLAEALATVPEDQPFFLYFGFNQPHRSFGKDHEGIDPSTLLLPPDWPDLPEVRLDYARFLAEVRDLDHGFGLVLQFLEERGLAENTLVAFMGDNGEALLRGKGTLYARGLNVPLMVRWPNRVAPDTVSDALISGEDLAPTFLAAAGLQPAEGMTGINFLPALRGQSYSAREYAFGERGWHHGPVTRTDGFDLSRSIVSERYNFIYNALPDRNYTPVDMAEKNIAWDAIQESHLSGTLSDLHATLYFQSPRPTFELYDLQNDPYELNNLAGQASVSEIERTLREELDRWMVQESDYLPLPTHAFQNMQSR